MPTRNAVLTERQVQLLETLVKSGRYQNASEVLRDGLRLVEQREAEEAGKLKALRAAARAGVRALDRRRIQGVFDHRGVTSLFERPHGGGHLGVASDGTIEIVRIVHDRMDFRRHLPSVTDTE